MADSTPTTAEVENSPSGGMTSVTHCEPAGGQGWCHGNSIKVGRLPLLTKGTKGLEGQAGLLPL